jgi:Metallo-peptidase family M12B Reprolysin-like
MVTLITQNSLISVSLGYVVQSGEFMRIAKVSLLAGALVFGASLPLGAATLFNASHGSLSADLPEAVRSATVRIDHAALSAIQPGEALVIAVPGAGTHAFKILRRSVSADVLLIEGVLAKDPHYRLVLGVRAEGVSGVISTPTGVFSLGYVNGQQWLGLAGAADQRLVAQSGERPLIFGNRVAHKSEKPPVKGAQPITLNLANLAEMAPGDQAVLNLADLGALRVSYEETRANADSASWVGYLSDFGKDYRVVLTYSPTGTIGHILGPQGEYSIETTANGETYLIDPRKLGLQRKEGNESCEVMVPRDKASVVAAHNGGTGDAVASTSGDTGTSAGATPLPGSTTVDVLILYTPGFVTDKGSVAQAQAAIDHLVSLTNQAYIDSGVPLQIRKVAAEQVSVSDTTSNSSTLTALSNGTGGFSGVKARRDALGADLVSIVRPFYEQYHQGCGIAWIGGYNGSSISGSVNNAFSVVSEGSDRAGTGWYCDVTSFAHELGHNQGLMHDRATVINQGGGMGATAYAYGYGRSGTFGTVMSYIWPKVGKFSNPSDLTCAGNLRCGVPASDTANSADNAQALNFTRAGVAGYRTATTSNPPPSTTTKTITGLITVNGVPKLTATVTGAPCVTGSNGVFQCTVSNGFTGTLRPAYVRNGLSAGFTPRLRSYSNLTTSQTNQNFRGSW